MKTLYIECNMGAAGDMLMAALYELLTDKREFLDTMNGLGLPGMRVKAIASSTCGIAGTHMAVTVDGQEETEPSVQEAVDTHHLHSHGHDHEHEHHHHHATPSHIGEIISTLSLPEEVKAQAKAVYDAIASGGQGSRLLSGGCPLSRGGGPGCGG